MKTLFLLMLLVLGARMPFWNSHPVLSTDVYRYMWDGELLKNGVNPLSVSPNHASVASLHLNVPLPPDHNDIPSIYPPVAALYFAGLASIQNQPIIFEIAATLCDMLTVLFLALALKKRNRSMAWALLFAIHPLSIIESGHNGHVEALGILMLSIALFLQPKRETISAFFILMCGLIKLWPISLTSLFWKKSKVRTLLTLIFFVGLAGTYWLKGGSAEGLHRYASTWEFHAGLYSILRLIVEPSAARILCLAGFLVSLFFISKASIPFERGGLLMVGAFLVFCPTVHPWYALWLLPFLVFEFQMEWAYFSLAILTSYAVIPKYLTDKVWSEASWPRLACYVPLIGGIAFRFFVYARKKKQVPALESSVQ